MTDRKPFILVADDNEQDRSAMAEALKQAGYDVMQAVDSGSARKVANEYDVDVAIIDHFMTPHSGVEFAKFMVYDQINMPMYLVTHEDDSDLLSEATHLGFLGLLKKPVAPDRLIKAVERAIKLREREREMQESAS